MRRHLMAPLRLLAFRPATRRWKNSRMWSSFNKERATEEVHAKSTLITWKRISLFVAAPVVGYLTWKLLIVGDTNPGPDGDMEGSQGGHSGGVVARVVARVREGWLQVFEDPEKRDKERWEHLARMQRRKKEYLAKKAAAIDKHIPLQPMNIVEEMRNTPVNPVDSEIDN